MHEVRKSIDPLAERIRMIGQYIEAKQLEQIPHTASVHSTAAGQTPREMIEEAGANLLVVIKGMRDAAKAADDNNDPVQWTCFRRSFKFTKSTSGSYGKLKKNGLNP
jgi:DNA-binding ferritin-like protein